MDRVGGVNSGEKKKDRETWPEGHVVCSQVAEDGRGRAGERRRRRCGRCPGGQGQLPEHCKQDRRDGQPCRARVHTRACPGGA